MPAPSDGKTGENAGRKRVTSHVSFFLISVGTSAGTPTRRSDAMGTAVMRCQGWTPFMELELGEFSAPYAV